MFNRNRDETLEREILVELQQIKKRLTRMETRLFRLAKAQGHEDVMFRPDDEDVERQ